MSQIFTDILNQQDIAVLLDYSNTVDDRSDIRETVSSKHPRWNIDTWPQHIIKRALDQVLEQTHTVEEVVINDSRISFQIHTDGGYNNTLRYKNVLFPLLTGPEGAATILFDNYYTGDASKFTKESDPYMRKSDKPDQHTTMDTRITDYTLIENFNDEPFDKFFHSQYLNHIPYGNLHGLTIDKLVIWNPGDAIVFDRTQLHCASCHHQRKIGLTCFTNLVV